MSSSSSSSSWDVIVQFVLFSDVQLGPGPAGYDIRKPFGEHAMSIEKSVRFKEAQGKLEISIRPALYET